jgi:hypothetical protein
MKKIAIIRGTVNTYYSNYDDNTQAFVANHISDWFEIEEEDLADLRQYLHTYEPTYRLVEMPIPTKVEFEHLLSKSKQFITERRKKEEQRREKSRIAAQKARQTKLAKEQEKELALLKKLQDKYNGEQIE